MVLTREKSLLVAFLALTAIFAQGCYQGEIDGSNFKFVIEPQTIPGAGPFGGVLSTLGLDLPFSSAIPASAATDKQVTEVYLNTIALRTTISSDSDRDGKAIKERMEDDSLIGPCEPGQAKVDFLKTLEILIQGSAAGSKKTRLAHFTNTGPGSCGFFMTIDIDPASGMPYNLKKFLPNYTITTSATGSSPATEVKLGGYVGMDFTMPNVKAPQDPQQQ